MLNDVIISYSVSRDEAKQLFIRLLYLGTFETWATDNILINYEILNFVKKFQNELKHIGDMLVDKNPLLYEAIKERKEKQNKPTDNINKSLISYLIQTHENLILETAFLYLRDNKYIKNNCVLCYDGIMIPIENYKPKLLVDLEQHIYNKLGFKIKFVKKDTNEGFNIDEIEEGQQEDDIIFITEKKMHQYKFK